MCIAAIMVVTAGVVLPLRGTAAHQGLGDRSAEVQAKLAELEAAGTPLTGRDLAPPPVAEADNAAPLYLQAAELTRNRWSGPSDGSVGYANADWRKPEDLERVADLLAQDQQALDLIREATARPHCRFDTPYGDLVMGILPHLAQMRNLARLQAAAAVVASHSGDQAGALEHLRRGLVIVRRTAEEGLTLSYLVANFIDHVVLRAGEYVLSQGELPETAAHALAEELRRVDWHHLLVRAIQSERVLGLQLFDLARKGEARGASELVGGESDPRAEGVLVTYAWPQTAPLMARDQLLFLEYMDRLEEAASRPFPEVPGLVAEIAADYRTPAPELAELEAAVAARRDAEDLRNPSPFNPVTRIVVPVSAGLVSGSRGGGASALRAIHDAVLGLTLYHQRHGAYPEQLEDLLSMDWPVPMDYYTEEPLVYRREGKSFVLYSLGPDLMDNGGTAVYWQERDPAKRVRPAGQGDQPDQGDITWQPW